MYLQKLLKSQGGRLGRKDLVQGILKGAHCTVDLLFDWFGISCMTTDNFCFYLQNRPIQTSQAGVQWYSDTSPFSIPCLVALLKGGEGGGRKRLKLGCRNAYLKKRMFYCIICL